MNISPRRFASSGLATGAATALVSSLCITLSGCAADSVARSEQPIVGGTRGGNPSVLWLYDTSLGAMCTASLIAPRVILTVRGAGYRMRDP